MARPKRKKTSGWTRKGMAKTKAINPAASAPNMPALDGGEEAKVRQGRALGQAGVGSGWPAAAAGRQTRP
jgi:hypothetical protein